mgnify:CR=1 FL=1
MMVKIYYWPVVVLITVLWLLVRFVVNVQQGHVSWKRELQLILVYICIVVVTRFTFFPFEKVNGQIQPLLFDSERIFPPWTNFEPFVHLFHYPETRIAWLNLIGNYTMFIPLGIVWPSVFRQLDTHRKVLAAGVGYSLLIEFMQLFFYTRNTDIDDLILNSLGYLTGYVLYLLVKAIVRLCKRK